MKQTHTTKLKLGEEEFELELELAIASAEPDVGIMSSYIEDWSIISVNDNTLKEVCEAMYQRIDNEYGEEKFVEKLHNEEAAEIDYYDAGDC